jgi:hypothetical protein
MFGTLHFFLTLWVDLNSLLFYCMQSSLIDPEIDTCRNWTELIDDDLQESNSKMGKRWEKIKMYTYALMHLQRIRWRSSRAYQGREISHPRDDHKAHFAIPSQSFSFVPEISTNLNSSLHDQFLELLSSMLVLITFMRYLFWQLTKVACC